MSVYSPALDNAVKLRIHGRLGAGGPLQPLAVESLADYPELQQAVQQYRAGMGAQVAAQTPQA